ncbi:hypothetical protein CFP56_025688, partial [Quercus suber]
ALSIRGSSLAHNPLFSHHLVPCREPASTKVKPWVPNSNQETVFDIKVLQEAQIPYIHNIPSPRHGLWIQMYKY